MQTVDLILLVFYIKTIILVCGNNADTLYNLSENCSRDLTYYIQQAVAGEPWALQMLDANPKAPDGFMYGNWKHAGNYDECVRVEAPGFRFTGKYCLTQITLNATQPRSPLVPPAGSGQFMKWGVCVPSTCSAYDAALTAQTAAALLPSLLGPVAVTITAMEESCYVLGRRYEFGVGFWCFVALQITLLTLTLVATIASLRSRNKIALSSTPIDWADADGWRATLAAFDVRANLHQLYSIHHNVGALKCVDGVRAITMLWILFGHRSNDDINTWTSNYVQAGRIYSQPLAMPVVNSYLAVDSFLLLSGALAYLTCAKALQKCKFDMFRYLAYRYLRLSVPYAVVIFYYATVMLHTGTGPFWYDEVAGSTEGCHKYWWQALLYIQNYADFGKSCMSHTWYLSVDMQLSWMAPLLIVPLYHAPRAGYQIAILVLLTACFIPFTVAYMNELFWAYHGTEFFINFAYSVLMYFPTHTRASPYVWGVIFGHIMYCTKDKQMAFLEKKGLVAGCWIIAMVMSGVVMFSLAIPYQSWYDYKPVDSAFYNGFSHLGWVLGISWLIFACSHGVGGPVNTVLSWYGWLPLSRLSYCAYLVQFAWLKIEMGTMRVPFHFGIMGSLCHFMGDLTPVMMLAVLLHLMVEVPAIKLLRRTIRT